MRRFFSLLLSAVMLLSLCLSASAEGETRAVATLNVATIDQSRTGSLTVYKYDLTSAEADGLTDSVYLSTGQENPEAAAAFAPYAIPGVEFSYLRVGGIETHTVRNGSANQIQVIYGVEEDSLLSALGLTEEDRAATQGGVDYYTSDTLIRALSEKLTANNTSTKDKLEALMEESGRAVSMPLTDSTGKTSADQLELGLYLVVETSVPENVTYTVDPFLVSVPMTDTEELDHWFYDVTVYPKNRTGNPTLDKEVSDGNHGLSFSDAEAGYEDVATVSGNDRVNYRILSTLPSIHSTATYLTQYDFVDTLSKGIAYNQNDVKICWYQDRSVAELDYTVATGSTGAENGAAADVTWSYGSEYFTVSYGGGEDGSTTMTIRLTEAGLAQVNTPASDAGQEGRFSGWNMVIYYSATLRPDDAVTYGDAGNPNDVTLTWSRTTDGYYDTLSDEAKVYSYGLDLTKVLDEGGTAFSEVQFTLENRSDETGFFYLTAEKAEDGVYYVTGGTNSAEEAAHFSPNSQGKLLIYGLEEDLYELVEVKTASGYTLLKDSIFILISTGYTASQPCGSLTANAAVDGNDVEMTSQGDSVHALVPLTVLNHRGFDLPKTGGAGTLVTTVCGALLLSGMAALAVVLVRNRRKHP